MLRHLAIAVSVATAVSTPVSAQTPQAALNELLGAEQSLSEAAAKLSPAEGIASLIADDGLLFTRQGPVRGPQAAAASLGANPANKGNHATWHSIRGGISADGQQGFTLGYLDVDGGDPASAHRRYLAYWVRKAEGWRVAAFKQVIRPADEVLSTAQPPVVPAKAVAANSTKTSAHKASLMAAEKAFSDRAQVIGVPKAFQENGRQDAIHLFGPKGFAIGLKAIGENQQSQPAGPTTINWSADDAVVASSGDLGVTLGNIRSNGPPPEGQPAAVPFFTIWMRDDPDQPWKYIAE